MAMIREDRWNRHLRVTMIPDALAPYGAEVKQYLPEIRKLTQPYLENPQKASIINKAIKAIENGKPVDLTSIASEIRDVDPREAYRTAFIEERESQTKQENRGPGTKPQSGKPRRKPVVLAPKRKVAKEPSAEATAEYSKRLRGMVEASLASGRRVKYYDSRMRTDVIVKSIDREGTLAVRGLRMPVTMSRVLSSLPVKDCASLAAGVMDAGSESDNAVVAFYLVASGDTSRAEEYLNASGAKKDILSAFGL